MENVWVTTDPVIKLIAHDNGTFSAWLSTDADGDVIFGKAHSSVEAALTYLVVEMRKEYESLAEMPEWTLSSSELVLRVWLAQMVRRAARQVSL